MSNVKNPGRLTRAELQIMELVWDLGEGSVREIVEAIPEDSRPAYTTVQTLIGRLEEKGAVRRSRKIGNAYMYAPVITRKSTYRRLVDELLDLFGGASAPIVSHLVDSGKLTLGDIREIESRLAKKARKS